MIAGLISPVKWLAVLCVLDYTFWAFLFVIFIADRKKKDDADCEIKQKEDIT